MPASSRRASNDQILDLVKSRHEHSRQAFDPAYIKFARQYNTYRMWHRGMFQPHRNSIVVPFAYSMVWADVARKMNTSFNGPEIMDVFGWGPEDERIAQKNKVLLNSQLSDAKAYEKFVDLIVMSDIYGTGILRWGWKFEEQELLRRQAVAAPITGEVLEQFATERRITFDGPDLKIIDPLDFFPQPQVTDIDEMLWVIERYTLEFDEVEMLAQDVDSETRGIFDKEAIPLLRATNAPTPREFSHVHPSDHKDTRRGNEIRHPARGERFAQPVEILEMWGIVPKDMVSEGEENESPPVNRVISIANGQVVLRNRVNPYWQGFKPYLALRGLPDPHFFFGPGKVEVTQKLQWAASRLASQKLDVLELFADPAFYVNRDAQVETRNLNMRPGRLFFGSGPQSDAIQAIIPDLRGMQNIYTEIEQLNQLQQRGSGITDESAGLMGDSRQTARQFVGRQESLNVRLLLESRILEETVLEPLVNRGFIHMNQQFLEPGKEIKMIGGNVIDPFTGSQLPAERERVELDDLFHDYDVRALGSTYAIPKSIRAQNLALVGQLINANPLAAGLINQVAFARELFKANDINNYEELLTVPAVQTEAIQQLTAAGVFGRAQGGQGPAQGGGTETLTPIGGFDQINASL